ncbi:MAG: 1-acyl-sn-glycerol-3-phosphate acyltransferase [Bradymonadaceae bacterium]|nr:1-acyl-sn-glycerol-3-phosphate acyltransferase [Lujinxingiaceae bacterium]
MLTLDVMNNIRLSRRPIGQVAMATLVLGPNFNFPLRRTRITLEGIENLPKDEPVILAMNHTDRYNYWPFQYRLWRDHKRFTTTWVKGKYFNNKAIERFMVSMANVPVPSRGYLISADAINLLDRPLSEEAYRLLRDALDAGESNTRMVREAAADRGVLGEVLSVFDTARNMLGLDFDPNRQSYFEAMGELFDRMMDRFIQLNFEAFDLGLSILVFPEGTRARRLSEGHTGVAQMALRLGATVVPVGCNGSDHVYPGNSPLARGGNIVYRLGAPLRPDGDLAPFQIAEPFRPFTREAEHKYSANFRGLTDVVMERINALLDARYQRAEGGETLVKGSKRFM